MCRSRASGATTARGFFLDSPKILGLEAYFAGCAAPSSQAATVRTTTRIRRGHDTRIREESDLIGAGGTPLRGQGKPSESGVAWIGQRGRSGVWFQNGIAGR